VVVAQHAVEAGEGVALELAGLLVLASDPKVAPRRLAECSVMKWSSPRTRRHRVTASLRSWHAC
jgi:hypothetical protein